jgi:hypothetical protein
MLPFNTLFFEKRLVFNLFSIVNEDLFFTLVTMLCSLRIYPNPSKRIYPLKCTTGYLTGYFNG